MHSLLVVDDDDMVRGVLHALADSFGYKVHEARGAEEALEKLKHIRADIALCDVNMPGHDGVWLASRIRELFPQTAVIMSTAMHDIETAVTSLRADIVDYLLKPYDSARLLEALRLGLEWHRASVAAEDLQHALQDRLRARRAEVAAALAGAQATPERALDGLISMLELHERDGREHATRVARMALALADELSVAHAELADIERGALLHDIGKIDMPARILYKPAPLDDHEWAVMRTHPRVGYDLLRRVPALAGAAEIVLASHEAWDGTGYPRGIKGEDIPLGSRILAIADSYDSMTRPHTQRPPMPPAQAIREIERCSGTQFDPRVARALGAVLAHVVEEQVA